MNFGIVIWICYFHRRCRRFKAIYMNTQIYTYQLILIKLSFWCHRSLFSMNFRCCCCCCCDFSFFHSSFVYMNVNNFVTAKKHLVCSTFQTFICVRYFFFSFNTFQPWFVFSLLYICYSQLLFSCMCMYCMYRLVLWSISTNIAMTKCKLFLVMLKKMKKRNLLKF